jgi:hypothetical protein
MRAGPRPHPGEFITEVQLEPNNLSGRELAIKLVVAASSPNRILTGASGLSPEMALRTSLHTSRKIRFSGEICLNRLDDRPQGNSQTIAQHSFLSGDRSSCDGTFFLKVNRYKLPQRDNARSLSWQIDFLPDYVGYASASISSEPVFFLYSLCIPLMRDLQNVVH